jgi:hypothetical protein
MSIRAAVTYSNTYAAVLARTIDICLCGWIWRKYDITISAMTRLELKTPAPRGWAKRLGAFLDWIQPNHCELARQADIERALEALTILGPMPELPVA